MLHVFVLWPQVNGDHDWYCFECHSSGDVLECSKCWRVYHPHCVKSPTSVFVCPICKVGLIIVKCFVAIVDRFATF